MARIAGRQLLGFVEGLVMRTRMLTGIDLVVLGVGMTALTQAWRDDTETRDLLAALWTQEVPKSFLRVGDRRINWSHIDCVVPQGWDPLESTCRHASLSIL